MSDSSYFLLIQNLIEVIGILAFAISGMMAGIKRQMDLVGITMVAGLTAFGGGTLRDILLDRRPLFWVEQYYWLIVIMVMVLLAIRLMKNHHADLTLRMIEIPDAFGLAIFTILGMQVAIQAELPWLICILMGVISAAFGGVLRDIACGEKPQLFFDHKPYATIALFGGGVYYAMVTYLQLPFWQEAIAFLLMISLRIASVYRGWSLPKPHV